MLFTGCSPPFTAVTKRICRHIAQRARDGILLPPINGIARRIEAAGPCNRCLYSLSHWISPTKSGRKLLPLLLWYRYASAAPSALHFATPSSSGASLQMTLSAARLMPLSAHLLSQERIHAPSPQP